MPDSAAGLVFSDLNKAIAYVGDYNEIPLRKRLAAGPHGLLSPVDRGNDSQRESPGGLLEPTPSTSSVSDYDNATSFMESMQPMDTINPRRRFLQQTAALTVAAGLPVMSGADEPVTMPIIDTHQHLWDLSRFRLPWLKGDAKLDRSFLMEDYRQATQGLDVVASVYMEVDVEPSQQMAEADYVVDLIRKGGTPMVGAVISGRPAADGFADYLARYKDQPAIKGCDGCSMPPIRPRGTASTSDSSKASGCSASQA